MYGDVKVVVLLIHSIIAALLQCSPVVTSGTKTLPISFEFHPCSSTPPHIGNPPCIGLYAVLSLASQGVVPMLCRSLAFCFLRDSAAFQKIGQVQSQ